MLLIEVKVNKIRRELVTHTQMSSMFIKREHKQKCKTGSRNQVNKSKMPTEGSKQSENHVF